MSKNSLLKGAMWGTIAVFLSKVLGFIYLIPFNRFLEVDQQIIFTSAYRIYAYVLLIATAGIPFATANMIAKYNAYKNYSVSFKLLRTNVLLMFAIGIVCASGMMLLSNPLAKIIVTSSTDPTVLSNVSTGIKIISTALVFVPMISVIRGFFQGYKEIQVSSMSQLVEQFINSTFILAILLLAGSGIVSNLFAVYFATFCATLGSVVSLFYLIVQYRRLRRMFIAYMKEGNELKTNEDISIKQLYKELIAISLPYIMVILLAQSNDLIDLMYTIRGLVANGFNMEDAKEFSTIYGANVNKLLTIPMTISTGLSVALVPHLSEAYAQRDGLKIRDLISKILDGTVVVLVPIVLLMMAASYETFFIISAGRNAEYGSYIFNYFGIYAIVNTFSIIVDNMMLSLSQRKRALVFIGFSTFIKIISTLFLISSFGILGLALSSIIACLLSVIPSMIVLKNLFRLKYSKFFKTLFLSIGASSIMYIVVSFIANALKTTTFIGVLSETALLYSIGIIIYSFIAFKLNLIPDHIKNRILSVVK
ncbi:O-antigen/teichoic acid export membrane protein [Bacilli bacterium PM5-3]|nr:O-antigen/teichoic acid export membrane protein [Bacilli bacterium PM5-3]MDH6603797.1 O-antigen/teichoic acid export membrane protein [Bacilli bacterium PM5-9]